MVWAAGALAVATVAGAAYSSNKMAGGANTATNEQMWALQQQEAMAQPYTQMGQEAMPNLQALLATPGQNQKALAQEQALLGLGPQGSQGELTALQNTPGYQFALQQGDKGTINAATATGMNLSGNTLQGLSNYNQGLASQTYQSALGNISGYLGNQENLASGIVGMGQAAAAGQAANIGQAATNIGNIGMNNATNQANIGLGTLDSLSNIGSNAMEWNELQAMNAGVNNYNWGGDPSSPGFSGAPLADDPNDFYTSVVVSH